MDSAHKESLRTGASAGELQCNGCPTSGARSDPIPEKASSDGETEDGGKRRYEGENYAVVCCHESRIPAEYRQAACVRTLIAFSIICYCLVPLTVHFNVNYTVTVFCAHFSVVIV